MFKWWTAAAAVVLGMAACPVATAAAPPGGTLAPDSTGGGSIAWTGTVQPGDTTAASPDACFDEDRRPRDPELSGCDLFALDVQVPGDFYDRLIGGVQVDITDFGTADLDLGIYRRQADGRRGDAVGGSGTAAGATEQAAMTRASGAYYVVVVPYTTPAGQGYRGKASFRTRTPQPSLVELNAMGPLLGPENQRASRDEYISHSEPTIAMDPLDPDHLIAGSKMYENLPRYLFKIGTYESFDGGRTWEDQGHLPGYCTDDSGKEFPPACDPEDERYRVTSDPTIAFDDEGAAYANVLDAPGGTGGAGWNMQVHIKRRGEPWSQKITAHDNRGDPVSEQLLLDDKNWIAVDNSTTVDGSPNQPRDGKVGTIYVCWSFDFQPVGQQIVLVKSRDGGETWGGFAPGDNTPRPISQRTVIAGIGCHIAIGPEGEVYVTWYDYQLDQLWQAKSTDRGDSFTPGRPIASIAGVNEPFEGQAFRNLSLPTTAVDGRGTVYVAAASLNGRGSPIGGPASSSRGETGADIVLFQSKDGGSSYTGPVRVNQDESGSDQFQPWMAVTESGQLNVSYFDRRNDPNDYYIQTWLSRSNDGGATWTDVPVGHRFWDPAVNPPISTSGEFIGDYQGLVASDEVAIPFWNDTQAATLPADHPDHSPWQEVWSARISNVPRQGGDDGGDDGPQTARCLRQRQRMGRRGAGRRVRLGDTPKRMARRAGNPREARRAAFRYCVEGGGSVYVAFGGRLREARLIAATARGYRVSGVRPGMTLRQARRTARIRRAGRGLYQVGRGATAYAGARGRRIRLVAVTDRRLGRRPARVHRYLRRAHVRR